MVQKVKEEADLLPGYNLSIQGKNIQITDSLKAYLLERLSKLERFSQNIIDAVVRMEVQKLDHRIDVVLKFSHFTVKVHAITDDMYASIDKAADRLQTKILKYKNRMQDHHAQGRAVVDMKVNILRKLSEREELDEELEAKNMGRSEGYYKPEIIRTKKRPLKTLSIPEAMMKMELSEDPFLVYRSEEDHKIKVIYRTADGNYGLIEPQ